MAGEIEGAVETLNGRKRAILNGDRHKIPGNRDFLALLSGFDLDPKEVLREAARAGEQGAKFTAKTGVLNNGPVVAWFDGLATGLLIAEARAKAE